MIFIAYISIHVRTHIYVFVCNVYSKYNMRLAEKKIRTSTKKKDKETKQTYNITYYHIGDIETPDSYLYSHLYSYSMLHGYSQYSVISSVNVFENVLFKSSLIFEAMESASGWQIALLHCRCL